MIIFKIIGWFLQWPFILFIITNKMAISTMRQNDIVVDKIVRKWKAYQTKKRIKKSKVR